MMHPPLALLGERMVDGGLDLGRESGLSLPVRKPDRAALVPVFFHMSYLCRPIGGPWVD